ncbi:MAG: hypothetical protein GY778_23525 [bacterium]|nr:hypothetical protein [bacterium]
MLQRTVFLAVACACVTQAYAADIVVQCPDDLSIECGQSTDPANTGEATCSTTCGGAGIVWSQLPDQGVFQPGAYVRTDVLPPASTQLIADDFVLGIGQTVSKVRWWGGTCGTPEITVFRIQFFDSVGGLPGSALETVTTGSLTPAPTGETLTGCGFPSEAKFEFDITPAFDPVPGTYFFSVAGVDDDNAAPNFIWTGAASTGGGAFAGTSTDQTEPTISTPLGSEVAFELIGGSGTGTCAIEFSDASAPGCGNTETITRTWTATDACTNSIACDQVITVVDTTLPVLAGVPADATVDCAAVPAAGGVTATDACDGARTVDFSETRIDGLCTGDYSLTRVWTATDACGNEATATQNLAVTDTTAPAITCPQDRNLECPADTTPAATGLATAVDDCGVTAVSSSDDVVPVCGNSQTITRTWSASDDCNNSISCDQVIAADDTTPPEITVDSTPLVVVDADCSGDEAVTLPVANAEDDCQTSLPVGDDAPASFPAGGTTTVTFTAADDCGNSASATVDATVKFGATIEAHVHQLSFGWGFHPSVAKTPLVGVTVQAFARPGSEHCSHHQGWWHGWHWWRHVFHDCNESSPVNSAVTDANGIAVIDVPPGSYLLIALLDFDNDGTPDHYLGRRARNVDCGETLKRRLRLLVTPRGKRIAARICRFTGSELLVVEPDLMIWDDEEQEYPFGLESVGDWGVTVTVETPEGFVADEESLSTTVASDMEALQFTVTEVGSDLVPTKMTLELRHQGRVHTVRNNVGLLLTPDYARSRGFNVANLRAKGLIKERAGNRGQGHGHGNPLNE